jgi:hypothetical protein
MQVVKKALMSRDNGVFRPITQQRQWVFRKGPKDNGLQFFFSSLDAFVAHKVALCR